ncbi:MULTISPECIES: NUDIX domain-containing protein [Thermoactinomyces]|uniref:NUDIX domain-containing protein n=1 Tax=Thermoactinomyces daqus TaxID=1329516 RepID=A0A7W2AJ87_9BACL|nr:MULTISPECIES: NUDIX domain-containing protein [Thermoactinomyces]MBA4543688.1 NUDIX domain-containing protein [Thermoactinomyces daqus]MBH8597139.1 NUDIX domain-containing protein [Thermoactinomyces sp. CICC 10523]MBH8602699.1 NUDIX domain-containing protein [Thermoactinomyces sp. CICC 10522]MBH8606190.1 NUDIX domain-containing protein [Thermoactinomyces sp. CICC 10521]
MNKPYKIVAKAIIFDHQDRVLILRKSLEERLANDTHGWDFPGGGLEPSEPLMDALAREVMEETGLQVKVVAPAYIYDEIQEDKHLIIVKFACDKPLGELKLSSEHDHYFWVELHRLNEAEFPEWMKEEIRRAYRIYADFRGIQQ